MYCVKYMFLSLFLGNFNREFNKKVIKMRNLKLYVQKFIFNEYRIIGRFMKLFYLFDFIIQRKKHKNTIHSPSFKKSNKKLFFSIISTMELRIKKWVIINRIQIHPKRQDCHDDPRLLHNSNFQTFILW